MKDNPRRTQSNRSVRGKKPRTPSTQTPSTQAQSPHQNRLTQPSKATQPQASRQTAFIRSLSHLLPIAGLLTIGGLIIGGGLLSAKFIIAPKSIAWVNDYLPEGLQVPVPEWDRPQTLRDIQEHLQTGDHTVGDIIELENQDRLVPIFKNSYNCSSKCARITELRIYHPAKGNGPKRNQPHFRLVAQLEISPVPDWTIADSLAQSENGPSETSGEPLPLETYDSMDSPESGPGNWFNLTGKRQQGDYAVTYGQLFHYDANAQQLTALTVWSSPKAEKPIAWTQLTGSATPELLIDHSIGLEPYFQAYQVSLKGTPELTLISLKQSASKASGADKALKLAKVGLWSLAADRLNAIKANGGNWGTTAQAQLDLISYHAKLTQEQAKQNWSSPQQTVVAKLLNGEWQNAFNVLEKDPAAQTETREGLKMETVRLWKRLSVAIEDDPGDPILQAWTAMVMLDRDGTAKTKSWMARQENSTTRTRALQILAPSLLPQKSPVKPKPDRELKFPPQSPSPDPIVSPNQTTSPKEIPAPSPIVY
jgi:hypothetical protein